MKWPQIVGGFSPHGPVSTYDMLGVGPNIGGNVPTAQGWPAVNLALYIPFRLSIPVLVAQLFALIGSITTGNVDVGIYSAGGTKIVSSGATAIGTANLPQLFNIADTQLGPGLYYFGVCLTSTSGSLFAGSTGVTAVTGKLYGLAEQTAVSSLPATFTLATWSRTILPVCGFIPFPMSIL